MGSFGNLSVLGIQFHLCVQGQGWSEPTQLQWNRLNLHKIIVHFLKLPKIYRTDKYLTGLDKCPILRQFVIDILTDALKISTHFIG